MRRKADVDFWDKHPQFFEIRQFLYSLTSEPVNLAKSNALVIYAENAEITYTIEAKADDISVKEGIYVEGMNDFLKIEPDGYALMIGSNGELVEMYGEERAKKEGLT